MTPLFGSDPRVRIVGVVGRLLETTNVSSLNHIPLCFFKIRVAASKYLTDATAGSNRSSSICATKIEAFQAAYNVDVPILSAISFGKVCIS